MHLAVLAFQCSVGIQHDRGIMVHAGRAPLEQRADNHDRQFLGHFSQFLRCRTGNGLGLIEALGVFGLAEINAGMQFLQQDQTRPAAGRLANSGNGGGEIFAAVFGAGVLDEADFDC